jgi:hypothetical protein
MYSKSLLRGPSPARIDQENRELAGVIAARDEAVAETARGRARFHAQLAGLQAAAQSNEAVAQAAAESPVGLFPGRGPRTLQAAGRDVRSPQCAARRVREALPLQRRRWPLRRPVVGRATASRYSRCSFMLTRLTIIVKMVVLAN